MTAKNCSLGKNSGLWPSCVVQNFERRQSSYLSWYFGFICVQRDKVKLGCPSLFLCQYYRLSCLVSLTKPHTYECCSIHREWYHSCSDICGVLSTVSLLGVNFNRSVEVNRKKHKDTHTHKPALCCIAESATVVFFIACLWLSWCWLYTSCSQNVTVDTRTYSSFNKDRLSI